MIFYSIPLLHPQCGFYHFFCQKAFFFYTGYFFYLFLRAIRLYGNFTNHRRLFIVILSERDYHQISCFNTVRSFISEQTVGIFAFVVYCRIYINHKNLLKQVNVMCLTFLYHLFRPY